MKPGPELNLLIAIEVMGYTNIRMVDQSHTSGPRYFGTTTDRYGRAIEVSIPDFSGDIAAAWMVVEKFTNLPGHKPECWDVKLNVTIREAIITRVNDSGISVRQGKAFGKTIEHAICLAALKAVGAL